MGWRVFRFAIAGALCVSIACASHSAGAVASSGAGTKRYALADLSIAFPAGWKKVDSLLADLTMADPSQGGLQVFRGSFATRRPGETLAVVRRQLTQAVTADKAKTLVGTRVVQIGPEQGVRVDYKEVLPGGKRGAGEAFGVQHGDSSYLLSFHYLASKPEARTHIDAAIRSVRFSQHIAVAVIGTSGAVIGGSGTTGASLPERLLAKVQRLADVDYAVGSVEGNATIIDVTGKPIVFGGAPTLGFTVNPQHRRFNTVTLSNGAWPKSGEAIVDARTASLKHLRVAERIRVRALGKDNEVRISGVFKLGAPVGGVTLVGFNLRTAQVVLHKQGELDTIKVAAKPGVTDEQLRQQIRPLLPAGATVH